MSNEKKIRHTYDQLKKFVTERGQNRPDSYWPILFLNSFFLSITFLISTAVFSSWIISFLSKKPIDSFLGIDTPHTEFDSALRALFASSFAVSIIYRWVHMHSKDYVLEGIFFVLCLASIIVSYLSLILLLFLPEYQLMCLSYLWVAMLVVMASFQAAASDDKGNRKDIFSSDFYPAFFICATAFVSCLWVVRNYYGGETRDYIAIAPLALILIPRAIINKTVRRSKSIGQYAWYQIYSICTFMSVFSHLGYRWLCKEGQELDVTGKDFKETILLFLAILTWAGLLSYVSVFRSQNINEGNDSPDNNK